LKVPHLAEKQPNKNGKNPLLSSVSSQVMKMGKTHATKRIPILSHCVSWVLQLKVQCTKPTNRFGFTPLILYMKKKMKGRNR